MSRAARFGAALLAVALILVLGAAGHPTGETPPTTGTPPTRVHDGGVGAGVGGGLNEYPDSLAPTAVNTAPVVPAPAPPPPESTEVGGRSDPLFFAAAAVGLLVLVAAALLLRRFRRR